jgi:RNA polymerase-binding transcription factor DksA
MKETITKESKCKITPELIKEIKERIEQLIKRKKIDVDSLIIANCSQDQAAATGSLKAKAELEIKKLQKTFETIDGDKNYGKCLDCKEDIPIERLKSEPTANRCTHCQIIHDRKN